MSFQQIVHIVEFSHFLLIDLHILWTQDELNRYGLRSDRRRTLEEVGLSRPVYTN